MTKDNDGKIHSIQAESKFEISAVALKESKEKLTSQNKYKSSIQISKTKNQNLKVHPSSDPLIGCLGGGSDV